MTVVVGRWAGNDSTQELLRRENGTYCMTTYIRDRALDRDVTREEAGGWLDFIRHHGGDLFGEYQLLQAHLYKTADGLSGSKEADLDRMDKP